MKRFLLLLASVLAVAAAAPQEQPVLRVTARLVQVSVIVQDRRGEPVRDLEKNDFVLLDEGRQQPISVFSMETSDPLAAGEALPPNVYSNQLERRGGTPTSVTVILLDLVNTPWASQVYARNQVLKFLQQLQPGDRVALYGFGRSLRVIHDFTSSTASLLRVLARHRGEATPELEASLPEDPDTGDEEMDEFLREVADRQAEFFLTHRVQRTLAAIEAIAQHLHRLPGRKNLIWVSGGFPLAMGIDNPRPTAERRTFSREVDRAMRAVNNANVAIYPVDARGLLGLFETNPSFDPSRRTVFSRGAPPAIPYERRATATIDSMVELASRTGGRAFYNTNDIKGSLRNAIEDTRVTYTLGYYPKHDNWDGRFRKIEVRVKRPGGLRVRHRSGYFAYADEPQGKRERLALLSAAALSPLDATTLGLLVKAIPPGAADPNLLRLELGLKPQEIRFEQRGGSWHAELDVLFVQRNAEGQQLKGLRETLQFNFDRRKFESMLREGMLVSAQLELEPKAAELRIVAFDSATGAMGSVSIPLAPASAAAPPFRPRRSR